MQECRNVEALPPSVLRLFLKGRAPTVSTIAPSTASSAPRTMLNGRAWRGRVEIRCCGCGYGGVVANLPDHCPMCGGATWKASRARGRLPVFEPSGGAGR